MKCKFCNKEIVYDKDDGYWDNRVDALQWSPFCNDKDALNKKSKKPLILHEPNLFQEYLRELNEMH